MRGYVLIYDEGGGGHALLQKKSYFQNFSIERNVFMREPVCANPGQYTLPGGWLNPDVIKTSGTLGATMKQFRDESGISTERVTRLNCIDQGFYSPHGKCGRGRGVPFCVHFVQVDDVSVLAEEANVVLGQVKNLINDPGLSITDREEKLRKFSAETGLNDDAADCYECVLWTELKGMLQSSLEFEVSELEEWKTLVQQQNLFFNAEEGQEKRILNTISDPGRNRDWLVDGVEAFLSW